MQNDTTKNPTCIQRHNYTVSIVLEHVLVLEYSSHPDITMRQASD